MIPALLGARNMCDKLSLTLEHDFGPLADPTSTFMWVHPDWGEHRLTLFCFLTLPASAQRTCDLWTERFTLIIFARFNIVKKVKDKITSFFVSLGEGCCDGIDLWPLLFTVSSHLVLWFAILACHECRCPQLLTSGPSFTDCSSTLSSLLILSNTGC